MAILLFTALSGRAQQPITGHANDFSSIEYYPAPNQTLMKTRMAGAEAQPLAGGLLVIRQLKLETFGTNGSPEAIVEAPECIYDTQNSVANSAGKLSVQNGDGKIHIDGDGFLWRQNDNFLTISNNVRTLIVGLAFAAMSGTGAVAQTNLPAGTNAAPHMTHITSDHGDFDMTEGKRKATYYGNVHVDDPQMRLTCEWLVADLPESGGRMDRVVAKTNVVIDYADDHGQVNHATSDKAVYSTVVQNGTTNGWVTLTGHAVVTNASWTMTGEPIKIDIETRQTHAEHPSVNFNQTFMAKTNSPAAKTNNPAPPGTYLPPGADTNYPPGSLDGSRTSMPMQPRY
jgi:lipopolysaccharide export system protein LptA